MEKLHQGVRLTPNWTPGTPGEQAAAEETAVLGQLDHSRTSRQERLSSVVPSRASSSQLWQKML